MKYIKRRLTLVYPEESLANEITTKVAEMFEARGFEVIANMGKLGDSEEYGVADYQIGYDEISDLEIGAKYIKIRNVFRHNGTAKNVSAEIELIQKNNRWSSSRVDRVKITKDAGERAINNKINKILEKF